MVNVKNKVKIAFLGGRGLTSNYGGVENAIREIATGLTKFSELEVSVYGVGTNVKLNSDDKCAVKAINSPSLVYLKFGQFGMVLWSVLHIILFLRPKIVIVFASGPSVFTSLLKLAGIKVITSLRAIDSKRDKWGFIPRHILKFGEFSAWKFSDIFTFNSKEMGSYYSNKRCDGVYVPNGAKKISFSSSEEADILDRYNIKKNNFFLFAARLDPVKRLPILLKAYMKIEPSLRIPLIIAGGNSKNDEYVAQLKKMTVPGVQFIGHIDQAVLEPLLKNCRVFVSPSILEGMSNSILSAMINSKPVIAADIRANSDVLIDRRALFEPDNIEQLYEKLKLSIEDLDYCRDLGHSLNEICESNYSWDITTQIFYDCILNILKHK